MTSSAGDVYNRLLRAGPGSGAEPETAGLFTGVSIGIVTNTKDPEGLGRVKLRLPWLSDEAETTWARIASPMAGAGRGVYFPPEVDDEVLVAFEHGSPQSPFVVGALWNGRDKPPEANADGKNNVRMIKSRSGHVVRLVDQSGAEKIEIIDRSGKNSIVIDTAKNAITITTAGDLTLESTGGKVAVRGKTGVEIAAQADVKIQATGTAELKANGTLTVKGAVVNIN